MIKILVIRISSLGDVVLAAHLIDLLRAKFPESQIDFVTGAPYRQILDTMKSLDRRYTFGDGLSDKYDVVIDLQNNFRSRRLTRSLKALKVLRFHRTRLNRTLRIAFPYMRKSLSTPLHVARQYVQVAMPLGVTDDGHWGSITLPQEWTIATGILLQENNTATKELILMAIGGRHKTKIWPLEKWVELVKKAHENGFKNIGILGTEDDLMEALRLRESLGKSESITVFCGKTDLKSLTGLIAQAKLLVCGDSGPMHIAAAVGTPVVAIFGPTVKEFGFAPFTDKSRIAEVSDLICRPCHPHGPEKCPRGHFNCMNEIDPQQVMEKALELIGGSDQ